LSETERQKLTTNQRWVIKIGSALLTNDGTGLDAALMKSWVSQMAELVRNDVELCLVSSGAIAVGLQTLN
jgi:Glutamate 5-kinase